MIEIEEALRPLGKPERLRVGCAASDQMVEGVVVPLALAHLVGVRLGAEGWGLGLGLGVGCWNWG